jgi:hypothetical protein
LLSELGTEAEVRCYKLATSGGELMEWERTNLDVTASIEQDVVTLNVSMNDILVVQMFKALASL